MHLHLCLMRMREKSLRLNGSCFSTSCLFILYEYVCTFSFFLLFPLCDSPVSLECKLFNTQTSSCNSLKSEHSGASEFFRSLNRKLSQDQKNKEDQGITFYKPPWNICCPTWVEDVKIKSWKGGFLLKMPLLFIFKLRNTMWEVMISTPAHAEPHQVP